MSKATRIINKYHIKEMLLNGEPQFENFYKEELIQFCEVSRELLKKNKKYKEAIDKAKDKLYCLGEVLDADFQKQMLDILKEVE